MVFVFHFLGWEGGTSFFIKKSTASFHSRLRLKAFWAFWGKSNAILHYIQRQLQIARLDVDNSSTKKPVPGAGSVEMHLRLQPSKQQCVPVGHCLESSHRCFIDWGQRLYATGSGHLTAKKSERVIHFTELAKQRATLLMLRVMALCGAHCKLCAIFKSYFNNTWPKVYPTSSGKGE